MDARTIDLGTSHIATTDSEHSAIMARVPGAHRLTGRPRIAQPCPARRCISTGSYYVASTDGRPGVWLCQTHYEIVLELRRGRIRQRLDSALWRLRGKGQR